MTKNLAIIYWLILIASFAIGIFQFAKMNRAYRLIVSYLGVTCLSEGLAIGASILYGYNLIVYHVIAPISLFLLCLYFEQISPRLKKHRLGMLLGTLGITWALINSIFLQNPSTSLNTNFLIVESFMIIFLSLLAFYELLGSDEINIHLNPNFWFSGLLLVFWSFTFFYWLVGLTIRHYLPENGAWMDIMIWTINILIYSGFAIVFLFYRKMKTN